MIAPERTKYLTELAKEVYSYVFAKYQNKDRIFDNNISDWRSSLKQKISELSDEEKNYVKKVIESIKEDAIQQNKKL